MKRNRIICRAALNTSMVLMATFACETLTTSHANAVTLADWTFETSLPATAGPFAAESGLNATSSYASGSHASGSSVYSNPAGNGSSHSFSSNIWAVGDYYQFDTSTTGYQSISVQWDQTSSNTGPGQFELEYSTDGSNWTAFSGNIGTGVGGTAGTANTNGTTPYYTVLNNAAPNTAWTASAYNPVYTFTPAASGLTSLASQSEIYFRLADYSTVAALGTAAVATGGTDRVDNFIISGSPAVVAGPAVTWTNAANDNAWNTTSVDWTGTSGATKYADSDVVTFPDGKAGTVTIASGGVQPYSTTVSNNSGTYTISSSDSVGLGGPGSVTMNGTGTLVLTGTNTYLGGTNVNAGTLSIDNDAELGNAGGALAVNGAAVTFTGGATLNRSVVLGTGNATFNTNGQGVTIGSSSTTISGTGNFVKTGSGNLTLDAAIASTYSGTLSVLGSTGSSSLTFNESGSNDIAASTSPGNFTGDLKLANAALTLYIRGGYVSGGGTIYIQGNGPWIEGNAPVGTTGGATTTIGNNIVTSSFGDFGLGAITSCTLVVNGAISGPASQYFVGVGTVQLGNTSNSYQGPTVIDNTNSTGPTVNAGVAQLGADNVFPVGNELHFGDPYTTGLYNNSGVLDLNGHNQTVFGLATYYGPVTSSTTGGNTNSQFAPSNGISNSTTTMSTLTIDDQGNGDSTIYANPIGAVTAKNFTGTNNVALTLAPTETGELTLVNASTYTGPTKIMGGTLALSTGITGYTTTTVSGTTTFTPVFTTGSIANSPVTIGSAGTLVVSANTGAAVGALNGPSGAQVQLGDSVLTITGGPSTNYVGAFAGTITTNTGTGGLAITGGTQQLGGATHHLGTLSITGTGKLDLTNSNLIVDDRSGSTAAIVADLKSGALFTSNSINGNMMLTGLTLGYLDTGTQLDIKYTWDGDLNLDGTVTNSDLTAMTNGNGSSWATGDLNYDGVKNADDWSLFQLGAAAYNADKGLISAGVPEPTTLALIGLPVVMGLRRRRR